MIRVEPGLNTLGASAAARAISAAEISSEDLVNACLARIAERESTVKAWSFLDPELALGQARDRDRSRGPRGALHGVPIGIKDIIDTADMPTERASPIYGGRRPGQDADCVARARAAGAVILGKTVTTPLASQSPVATANPHNPDYTAGGSSSGTSAAVADFMVPLALGTQTGGSAIRPAAFCGIACIKPSFGRLSMNGAMPIALSFDTIGLAARGIEDLILLLSVLGDVPPAEPSPAKNIARLRIGYCETPFWSHADDGCRRAFAAAGAALNAAGAEVRPLDLPDDFPDLHDATGLLIAVESATSLREAFENHGDEMPPSLSRQVERGLAATPAAVQAARATLMRCAIGLAKVYETYDLLLAPSAAGEAPAGHSDTGDPIFNTFWTGLQGPCLTIPCGTGPNGLPLGVQLVGPVDSDRTLLSQAGMIADALAEGPSARREPAEASQVPSKARTVSR